MLGPLRNRRKSCCEIEVAYPCNSSAGLDVQGNIITTSRKRFEFEVAMELDLKIRPKGSRILAVEWQQRPRQASDDEMDGVSQGDTPVLMVWLMVTFLVNRNAVASQYVDMFGLH
jgi:hypothetical protein